MSYWFEDKKASESVILSSRVRLARNINGFPFPGSISNSKRKELKAIIKNAIENSDIPVAKSLRYIENADIPIEQRLAMADRHTISPAFATKDDGAILISEDENISIMICEEDHLRIQVIKPGKALQTAFEIANLLDDMLCNELDIAYDEQFGFLTQCPTNVGTGLRASYMMLMPGLSDKQAMEVLKSELKQHSLTLRGTYGEGSETKGGIFQISNIRSIGVNEQDIITELKTVGESLINLEKITTKKLDSIQQQDIVFRNLAVLKGARLLSFDELVKRLTSIKIGVECGYIPTPAITEMIIKSMPNMLMAKYGELSPVERDTKRAEYIRDCLKEYTL